jgi:hypothetical protein
VSLRTVAGLILGVMIAVPCLAIGAAALLT